MRNQIFFFVFYEFTFSVLNPFMMIFLLNFLMKQKYFILNQNGWTKEKPTHCLFFSANKKMLIRYSFKRFLCVFLSNFLCFVTGLSTKNALLQNRFFLHEKKMTALFFFFHCVKALSWFEYLAYFSVALLPFANNKYR